MNCLPPKLNKKSHFIKKLIFINLTKIINIPCKVQYTCELLSNEVLSKGNLH